MRRLFDVVRIANEGRSLFVCNFVPRRGARFQENLKWVKPEKKPAHHPAVSGDLVSFPELKKESVYFLFNESKELEKADEYVRKVFSLRYQMPRNFFKTYEKELVEKVKCHALDNSSEEVKIAKLTARIRYFQHRFYNNIKVTGSARRIVKERIDKRKQILRILRLKDYKRFEWVLEKLDLEFRPYVARGDNTVTRKKSLTILAKLKVEQVREERLAAYKKSLDSQKVPFLENKIKKLKEIMETEKKYNLPETVTEEDVKECAEKLEKVKIDVAAKSKRNYLRKVHPYFLEVYDADLLWEKEKAAELIREKQELENQQKTEEKSTS